MHSLKYCKKINKDSSAIPAQTYSFTAMVFFYALFWTCLLIIFYTYLGYGMVIGLVNGVNRLFKRAVRQVSYAPAVTLVVSAFNEEDFIEQKIQNTLLLEYDPSLFRLIFITDGSTDRTPELVKRHPNIQLLHEYERRGKVAAMNRAMAFVETPIVIFSDANTLLNPQAIKLIASHYQDPRVGGVAGEKKIVTSGKGGAANAGEGLYWQYESWMKKMDSELLSVVGAAGELFSLRTGLFESLPENTLIEDFVLSLRICLKGYVIRYEPSAYASETSSASIQEEQKRKIRICAGGFQAMTMLRRLLNPIGHPLLTFQYISHRVLRWTACPLALLFLLIANIIIVLGASPGYFYYVSILVQALFYVLALIGWAFANRNIRVKSLYIPYYFLFMNASVYFGFVRFVKKNQSVLWEKAERQKIVKIP